ncbi:MAG: LCP family protein [Kineosporiaceae bacterium]
MPSTIDDGGAGTRLLAAPAAPTVSAQPAPSRLRPLADARPLGPAMRVRRAYSLLALTLVAPGSAQLVAGRRGVGRWALRVWAGVLALLLLAGVLALVARPAAVWLLARPTVLWLAALVCFALAVAWPVLVVDAWRLAQVRSLPMRSRRGVAALAALLVLVTALPTAAVGRRAWAAGSLISDVFAGGGSAAATDGRLNVLLLGGDAGPDRIGLRPDSITLASIDARSGRTVLFSLPRNLENVNFPAGSRAAAALPKGWNCGDTCLLNALYTWGSEHRSQFPGVADPGAELMKEAVEGVLGLKVNYYVLIDLRGFRSLIDAVGGVRLTVGQRVPIGGGTSRVTGWIEPGTRTLDGYHALWFARSRHGASDYARMARQRCVMSAMLQQLDPATVLANFQSIASAGKQVVSTDIPASQLSRFLSLAGRARSQKVSSVQFVPPLIQPARPDQAVVRAAVTDALRKAAGGDGSAGKGPKAASPKAGDAGTPSRTQGVAKPSAGAPEPRAAASGSAGATSTGPAASTDDISGICSA